MKNDLIKEFGELALTVFEAATMPFGFKLESTKTEQHFFEIVFVNGERYVKVSASSDPREEPSYFNVVLGEGPRGFSESDWNSVALWRLKNLIVSNTRGKEYGLGTSEKLPYVLGHARAELLEYGKAFLAGDLESFRQARADQNRRREPYKVYTPDKDGKYSVTVEPKSLRMKLKYS